MEDIFPTALDGRIEFGPFCFTPGERLLTKDGTPLEIGGRSLDLLTALLEQPGRVLSKRELMERIWPGQIAEEGSLRFHLAGLRKLLGDGENGARYIATQVGVGYAFVASVRRLSASDDDSMDARNPQLANAARLPARLTRMIGREQDAQLLNDLIPDTHLFTIVGPGGVGKTTLAIEIAHASASRFADGVGFVDLETVEDANLISSAIAGALGIPVQAEEPLTVVLGHIRSQELLLILDNCEHLIEAVSTVVERIRDAAPQVSILATSREPLRARGEHVHWLGSLDYPDETTELSRDELLAYPAVELFVERTSAGNSAFEIDLETARLIADMCRRLDGIALAIELTAVRAATHGSQATARLLGERFSLGWAGLRTAQPRQQTLQATLDWSYDLLSKVERRILERLSVFLGPFSIDAAIHVAQDETIDAETAMAVLDELTAKSLVSPDRSGDGSGYRLREMTRAYARKKLLDRGNAEFNAAARRHAGFFLLELEASESSEGSYAGRAADFSRQQSNIRSALDWTFGPDGDLPLGVRLAAASAPVFLTLSLLVECRTWCTRAIEHLEDHNRGTSVELELESALGLSLMFTRGNSQAAETALRRALEVAETLGDRWNQLRLLGRLHIFHERIGNFETAVIWAGKAVEVADAIDEPEATAVAASLSGISHHLAGNQGLARHDLELSLRQSLPSDRGRTIYYGFDHRNRSGIALARTLWLQGNADQAKRVAEHTVLEAARLDHPVTYCIALVWALSVYLWTGELKEAEATLSAFAGCADVNALGPYIAASGGLAGKLAVQRGEAGDAVAWIEESLARLRAARYDLLTTSFSISLIKGLALSGRYEGALDLVDATIDRCNANGELMAMAELLRIKAAVIQCIAGRGEGESEALLLESLAVSRRQGARAWELRSAIDLARLWTDRHRVAEARALLEPVRASFAEGFDTADLRTADQLLADIAGLEGGSIKESDSASLIPPLRSS